MMHTHVNMEEQDWNKVVTHNLNFDNFLNIDNTIIQNMEIYFARSKVILSDYPLRILGLNGAH